MIGRYIAIQALVQQLLWKNQSCPYLDFAALAEDYSHAIYIDDHSLDIGNLLRTSSVFILGVHSEVWQAGGDVARFGQGVGAGSHIMVGAFVKGSVVWITRYDADASSWAREMKI